MRCLAGLPPPLPEHGLATFCACLHACQAGAQLFDATVGDSLRPAQPHTKHVPLHRCTLGWLAGCRMGLGCMRATDASTSASFPCARCGGGAWHQQQTGSAWQAGWGWLGCCWLADLLTGPQVGPLSLFTPQWLAAFHTYPPRYVASPPAAASCADERRQALLQMRQLRGPVPCLRVPRLQRSRRGRAQTQHTGSF